MKAFQFKKRPWWLATIFLTTTAMAQSNFNTTIDSARHFQEKGNLATARTMFKNLLKQDQDNIEALRGLGEIAFLHGDWGKAKRRFNKVLQLKPDDLAAHYFSGIAYRETGKFRGPLLREIDLSKSINRLRFLTQNAPRFKDSFYQLALTFHEKERYRTAIELIHKQLGIKPELDSVQVDLFRHYRALLRHVDAKEAAIWLEQQKWPQATYFLGELARRNGDLPQALAIFKTILEEQNRLSKSPVLISMAKVYNALGRSDDADAMLDLSISAIERSLDAMFLFSEFKYIFSQQELIQFMTLEAAGQYQKFFRSLWHKRNPTPAAAQNPRWSEHLRRFLYAEKNYEYDGLRSWANNPDKLKWLHFPPGYQLNKEFNDKGLIYIRHGEPDERIFTIGESVPINESWRYHRVDGSGQNFFHFFSSPGNNWRLGSVIAQREILTNLSHWDPVYYRLSESSALERLALESELADQLNASVENGFTTDRHTFPKSIKPLDTPFSSATFRGKSGKTRFDIYVGVPIKPIYLASKYLPAGNKLQVGFAIDDLDWQPLHKELRQQEFILKTAETGQNQQELLLYSHEFEPQDIHAAFHVRPESSNFLGGAKFDATLPDYSNSELDMSDIVLAYGIQPANVNSDYSHYSLDVIPNPANAFQRGQTINVYFEIYNVQLNEDGTCHYNIEYNLTLLKKKKSFARKMFGFLQRKQKESITLRNSREGNSEFNAEYIGLDIRNMVPGAYLLQVLVRDKNTALAVMREKNLVIE